MNQQSGHLSDQQIQECAGTVPGGSPEEVEAHLSQCESCLERLLEWQRTQLRIGETEAMRPKPSADCYQESTLQEVAAEIASSETSARVLQHASQCDHCGSLLRQYLEDFSDEFSPEIEAVIDQLPFSQPQWQRQKAKEIVASSTSKWKRVWNQMVHPESAVKVPTTSGTMGTLSSRWKLPATAGAMATLLVVGIVRGPAIINWAQLRSANQSISAAFVEKRTIPGRLTGVDAGSYTQDSQKMGPGGEVDDLGWTPMIEAEGALSRKLASGGKVDPRWWQVKGRILLLKHPRNPEMAEPYFMQAQSLGMKDLSLEIDLAVTYFEKESLLDKPDFRKTIDKLNKVLESTHPAPTAEEKKAALYNLGLAYEKIDMGSAISTWEKYLKADPTGAWADDVRRHLDKDKDRKDEDRQKTSRQPVYLNPSDYNLHFREPEVSHNGEQYMPREFERLWLMQAVEDPASEAGKASRNIAENFQQQHSDPMLIDLFSPTAKGRLPPLQTLNATFTQNSNDATKDAAACPLKEGDPDRLAAIRALSAAFAFNKNSKQKEAIGCSQKAAELFAGTGNLAGELLAHFQEIYALQRELDFVACMEQVDKLYPRAAATQYHWLRGQLSLEKAICATHEFKSQSAQDALEASRRQAKDYDFPELKLRVIGAEAGIDRLNHHYQKAWTTAIEGLDQYWKEQSSSERYYQFYAVMRSIAADSGYLYASEAYLRRSISIFETAAPEDFALKAVLYTSLANLLWELGEDAAAETEARHARELIAATKAETAAPAYFELPAIELADFELRRHQPGLALSTLKQIGDVPQTRDNFVRLDFYRVRGSAKLQLGRFDEVGRDYQQGLEVAQEFFNHSTDEATRLRWVAATNRIYAGFVQILLAKGQNEKALAVWEWSKDRLLNPKNRRLLNVEEAGSLPLPQTAYPHIVYASFEDQLQIWLLKDGRVVGKSVPLKQSELLGRIRAFNINCSNKDSLESEVERQATELYELLLRPVIAGLSPSGIVAIEFDDAVPSFAIEALKKPAGGYFGEDFTVLQSPGILTEALLRDPAPLKPQDAFLVADASPDKGPEVLPGHELPARAINRIYSNKVLRGADLTAQNVDKEMQSSAALLIISHGLMGDEGIGLKLSEDWSLQAKDFTPQRLRKMRLVVLAACSSGYSENGLLGPDSLVRSLLAGGVPNTIASRWDVDSQSTGELFASFYTYLAQGEAPAQALRHARGDLRTSAPDLLQGRPKRTHPYYWAGFYLTGKLPASGR